MATTCSPYAPSRIIQSADQQDPTGWLGNIFRQAEASGLYTKIREGWDRDFTRRALGDLRRMSPANPEDITRYAIDRGWLRLDKSASLKAGDDVLVAAKMGGEEQGYAASVMKVALESQAGGIKQMADNFLMKVNAGQDATYEGLQFARQMKEMSRLGGFVLGWAQEVGRGVRSFGTARGLNMSVEGMADGAVDALGNPGDFADTFAGIAAKLQDPERQVEGIEELIGLAKRVQFLDQPHEIAKATLGMDIAGNAWTELFVNGLLSSPATFVTNAMGAVWVAARPMMQLGAAKLYAATGMAGSTEAALVAAEATANLGAIYSAFNDALKIGWHAARTETSLYQKTSKGIHGQILRDAGFEVTDGVYDTVNRIGEFVRLPSRALLGTDEFAKHLALRGEVAARGVRRAARQGVDITDRQALETFMQREAEMAFDLHRPELWEKYKVDSIYNLQSGVESGSGRTLAQVAAEGTFQEENAVASSVNGLLRRAPFLRPVVPFVRTPLNILKQGVWESTGMAALTKGADIALHNPTNAVFAIQQELLKDPSETFRMAGQIAFTTALGATLYGMAMNGQITGGGPKRWTRGRQGQAAQDAWVAAGNVPYSFKMGDQAVSFDRFGEPIAIVMRMMADLGQYSAYMDATEQDEVMAGMVSIMASGMYQASFLQGIDALIGAVNDDEDGYGKARLVQNYVATQTPFGGLLGFVERLDDPYKSAYQGATFNEVMRVHEDAFGTGIFAKAAARIPGMGSSPQLIDQLTGRPVPIVPGIGPKGANPLQMAVPVFPRNHSSDAVWKAVFEIRGDYIEKTPGGVKATPQEQQQFNALMAQSKVNGRTLGERILAFRRQPAVEKYVQNKGAALSGVKSGIEKELDRLIDEHRKIAFDQLIQVSPSYQERVLMKNAITVAAEDNNVGEARQLQQAMDDLYQRARRGY